MILLALLAAVTAVNAGYYAASGDPRSLGSAIFGAMIYLLVLHRTVKGERDCERCDGRGHRRDRQPDDDRYHPCPACKGTGLVRADRLVSLNAVVEALREPFRWTEGLCEFPPADFIERKFKEATNA